MTKQPAAAPALVALVPENVRRAVDAAQMAHPTLPAELRLKVGVQLFSQRVHPAIVPVEIPDRFMKDAGERTRRSLLNWLRSEAEKFSRAHGVHHDLAAEPRFTQVVEPLLHERGCGVEDWARHLQVSAQGEFRD